MAERSLAPTLATTTGLDFLIIRTLKWLNSGLAIYRAKGDPGSILLVAGSYFLTLLLLLVDTYYYERAPLGSPARDDRAMRAVVELHTMAFGVMACDSALAVHDARGDLVSAGAVLLAYAAFLTLTFRFLRAFAQAVRAGSAGRQGQHQGRGGGAENDDVH